MEAKTIAIIGGGASGLTAAITAAREGARAVIFEGNDRVGKKLLMTGNGKCNLTNLSYTEQQYFSSTPALLPGFLQLKDPEKVMDFLNSTGLFLMQKEWRIYPLSEQASSVLDALRFTCDEEGVEIRTGMKVSEITPADGGYMVMGEHFDRVIIACGGASHPETGSDGSGYKLAQKLGLQFSWIFPALCPLTCKENFFRQIAGVRARSKVTLFINGEDVRSETGEVQLTDYGISGICVFQLSRIAAEAIHTGEQVFVDIDFLPDMEEKEIHDEINLRLMVHGEATAQQLTNSLLPKKLLLVILKLSGIRPARPAAEAGEGWDAFCHIIKHFRTEITGSKGYDHAQTTAGGVLLSQVTEHLESREHPGLFFTGEMLDIDGICGGYNLHWAFASGMVAGEWAAKEKEGEAAQA